MALAGFDGHFKDEAILVAINKDLFYFLEMTALFAFFPEFFSASAVIDGEAGFNGLIKGFFVHICEHQDLAGS